MSETKELIIPITATAMELYEGDALAAVLDKIEEKALELVPDATTKAGRDLIRTNAAKVASSKTYLFGLGKDLTETHRNKVKSINSVRDGMETRLNDLRDKVRKPLTEYEEIEKARVKQTENTINLIVMMASAPIEHGSIEIQCQLDKLKEIIVDDSFGDLETPAFIEKEKSIEKLTAQLETVKQREKDQKELADLRKKNEERDTKEAAERAEKEIETRIETAVESQLEEVKTEAVAGEQTRVATATATATAATTQRESDKQHKAKINNAAVNQLFKTCSVSRDEAKQVITAIASNLIPNVKITY